MARSEVVVPPATTSPAARIPAWVPLTGLALTLVGLGISVYLTVAHYQSSAVLACPESATINCVKVTTSPESVILGIPVAVLGLAFFVAMLPLQTPRAWRSDLPIVRYGRLGMSAVGVAMVCWLVYAELFRIDAICLYCTAVHVATVLLFAVTAVGTAVATEDAYAD